ncbi:hypothetical protein [uncultured Algimonas sp.]|uniref:hypothetical protein n=1 Tax=uncultured Algimonas sp. TaxID=1547920 RepID=UPI002639B370|nr:hypothetical protein [uncultured Algimonas sp.]
MIRGILTCLFFILPVTLALAQTDDGYGLTERTQNRILGVEQDYEAMIQDMVPEFRLVRTLETFPPIEEQTYPLRFDLSDEDKLSASRRNSPPFIVTLHETQTGRPIANCAAPCSLDAPLQRGLIVQLYRFGSDPIHVTAESYHEANDPHPIYLPFNEVDHQLVREKCRAEFEVIRQSVASREASNCVRVPPMMPPEAERSGHCVVAFTVAEDGDTVDVRSRECTEQIFCDPSAKAVRHFIYHPELRYGTPREVRDMETKMMFRLVSEDGTLIPEPDGPMEPCVGSV